MLLHAVRQQGFAQCKPLFCLARVLRCANERLRDSAASRLEGVEPVLIGYMRVSKADGSQVVDLQQDALVAAGVGLSQSL